MTVCFYPADDGTWHAKIGHEELIIGKGIVEYYWYDPNADEDEAPVLQHRSVWFDDRDKATLTEYRDALRADCAGLRYMGEGLKSFLNDDWQRVSSNRTKPVDWFCLSRLSSYFRSFKRGVR
ncbi:hypothetical protein [Ochrobactrum soli]|uniref:Uncharacterized protein n=1 Tax=Ochrobactrum soli TaxID=2448455 RepID=A0A849KYY1_9HYPH|nr:hypothetical protein [[Ochrobactrum] soli]NNU63366.1 hypothetical protein [[Ochrobactrum] soli]